MIADLDTVYRAVVAARREHAGQQCPDAPLYTSPEQHADQCPLCDGLGIVPREES